MNSRCDLGWGVYGVCLYVCDVGVFACGISVCVC